MLMEPASDALAMCENPAGYFSHSINELFSLERPQVEAMQLEVLKHRFEQLRDKVPMLKSLLNSAEVDSIDSIDEIVPLLFDHTVYKSYPPSLLAKGRFDHLTRWLNKLTTHDLSGVDVSNCETIDEWIDTLAEQTPLLVSHSSGTSGTVSFLPIEREDFKRAAAMWPVTFMQEFGKSQTYFGECPEVPVVSFMNRSSRRTTGRFSDYACENIAGSEQKFHAIYPDTMSADLMYLAGKLRAAQAKGNMDSLEISPKLLARKDEFAKVKANEDEHRDSFLEDIAEQYAGQKLFVMSLGHTLYNAATNAAGKLPRQLFSPDSVVFCPGGSKGQQLPDDWREQIMELTGVDHITNAYGMSEVLGLNPICRHGHYHFVPWIIPFVLDPDSCEPLPRTGKVTGRAAFFDLGASTHWGGFISGDEITVHWDEPCACGMKGAYMEDNVERYTEKQGGDDKISCAATASAHEDALNFLLEGQAS
jgi:hypothetical protein